MRLRCAVYARYSSDQQNPLSIQDQLRKCHEFAERQGWLTLAEQIYTDEAASGVGSDRPGIAGLLRVASSNPRPFDVLLVDDTSRLSRRLADAMSIFERLNFAGIRIVAVSQGIDTQSEQADVLVTVHGLVDSLYVKELAKKTHRGLEGAALRGLHTGGRCFGYSNEATPDGVRLKVNESEAAIVQRIFEMCASGLSLKSIAKTLNAEGVPPPRPRAGKKYGTWCPTAIHAMLRRELYIGRLVWNRSRFIKVPGTNKRLRRARPRGEWRVSERPELRIISQELWRRVHERLAWAKEAYGRTQNTGLFSRSASSPYLLTGFLKCGVCGANLVIVAGRGKGGHRKYGCPQNFYRGACPNTLKERQDRLEERLFANLQTAVLRPEAIDYAVQEFGKQLQTALSSLSGELGRMRGRKDHLEAELRRLVAAVAEGGHSAFLLDAISSREGELREISDRLLSAGPESVQAQLEDIRRFITTRMADLRELLYTDVGRARFELGKHVTEIRMLPESTGKDAHYVATGAWDLLGGYAEGSENRKRVGLVAGGGFEPPTFGL